MKKGKFGKKKVEINTEKAKFIKKKGKLTPKREIP